MQASAIGHIRVAELKLDDIEAGGIQHLVWEVYSVSFEFDL